MCFHECHKHMNFDQFEQYQIFERVTVYLGLSTEVYNTSKGQTRSPHGHYFTVE